MIIVVINAPNPSKLGKAIQDYNPDKYCKIKLLWTTSKHVHETI